MDGQVIRNYDYVSEEEMDIRKGPWTVEEDAILADYVSMHGEGRWNAVARSSGLKRTGKSCRLRWLNYLRPDVRRGNITLQEQLLILELHSRWGNRWSKIAQYLPGRTDNEIKNYWRTRVQKQAKQLKCDVNSKQFRDAMRFVWMPRIMERIRASESNIIQPATATIDSNQIDYSYNIDIPAASKAAGYINHPGSDQSDPSHIPELSITSSDSWDTQVSPMSGLTDSQNESATTATNTTQPSGCYPESVQNGWGLYPANVTDSRGWWDKQQEEVNMQGTQQQQQQQQEQSNNNINLLLDGDSWESLLWNEENIWFLQQQLL